MKNFYFIGIGGTAMAGVAAALQQEGHRVTGVDNGVYPPMSDFLAAQGIAYHEQFDTANVTALPDETVVVIGNAMSRGNVEVEAVLNRKLPFTSLAGLVGEHLIAGNTSVVIAGTHGKSTTSSLAAWVLESASRAPGFLIGGIPENFGQGCRPAQANGVFVTEGDEYDTAFFDKRSKFVHYRPDVAVINNVEFDHADIFDSLDHVKRSFRQFVNLVPGNGILIVNGDDVNAMDVVRDAHSGVVTFGLGSLCNLVGGDIRYVDAHTAFTVTDKRTSHKHRFRLPLAGEFNVRNALAVIAVARHIGLTDEEIQQGFSTFRSIRRRMEVIAEGNGITLIDDFAHHPTALRLTLTALREKYEGRRLVACFEPRSNTTTRNIYQKEITDALALADVAVIGAIDRPHRYAENERLSPERVAADLEAQGVIARAIPDPLEMVEWVAAVMQSGDVIALCSNGKFGGAHRLLRERIVG
ncbi:MAG: UDP-N-acetylmuramate:L-alanyl-gamma-D-glutamyl-meso-diaminopimelate ligase [Bacteroidetes bacterium]|nr:UDP-N-acetylmuramate:L-alanyl-gamma-D-glutamyl-meso-diaminopimelate ligase [Bacteroidota bacterium]